MKQINVKRLMVITDTHIEGFQSYENKIRYWKHIEIIAASHNADCIIICGDVVGGKETISFLKDLHKIATIPYFFVLGNHDYWDSSFQNIEKECKTTPEIAEHYLNYTGVIQLNENTFLNGVSGFYDGGYGNIRFSNFHINDMTKIKELKEVSKFQKDDILQVIQEQTRSQIRLLKEQWGQIPDSTQDQKIITVSHVPPFPDLCYYAGNRTDSDALPYFSSRLMGDAFLDFQASCKPNRSILGLFGHTHSKAELILDQSTEEPIMHLETLPSFVESITKGIQPEDLQQRKFIKLIDI